MAIILAFTLLPVPRTTALAARPVFALVVMLFLRIAASNHREWRAQVSVTPYATLNGDRVTIQGVKYFDYRKVTT